MCESVMSSNDRGCLSMGVAMEYMNFAYLPTSTHLLRISIPHMYTCAFSHAKCGLMARLAVSGLGGNLPRYHFEAQPRNGSSLGMQRSITIKYLCLSLIY